jgi:Abortive infection C-terminus
MVHLPNLLAQLKNYHQDLHTGVSLDCCNSLLQSICKTIITQIDPRIEGKDLNKGAKSETNNLISEAAKLLQKNDDLYERDFISKFSQIGKHINELRNARGDLSHGKHIPKELLNDQDLSRLLREITESLSRYLISSFFSFKKLEQFKVKPEVEEDLIRYEDNPEFNELLDEDYPYDGKLLYSQALYALYCEDYAIQLQTFIDEQELFSKQ